MHLFTIRDGQRLHPATQFDLERLETIRSHEPLHTTVVFRRSGQHHRWYRGLVVVVAEAIGKPAEVLHQELKYRAGLIDRIVTIMGQDGKPQPAVCLRSTAFSSMDETDFASYTQVALEIVFRDYLVGVRRQDVLRRVEEMVGPRPR